MMSLFLQAAHVALPALLCASPPSMMGSIRTNTESLGNRKGESLARDGRNGAALNLIILTFDNQLVAFYEILQPK